MAYNWIQRMRNFTAAYCLLSCKTKMKREKYTKTNMQNKNNVPFT